MSNVHNSTLADGGEGRDKLQNELKRLNLPLLYTAYKTNISTLSINSIELDPLGAVF